MPVAGGQKRNHLSMVPYGCTGYRSTFSIYNPRFAQSYWKMIESGDISGAAAFPPLYASVSTG